MNPPPPEHQAPTSSESRHKRQPNDGETAKKLSVEQTFAKERLFLCKWTHRPSILASSPATPANDETESRDRDDCSDGAGQWRPWADIATPLLDVLLPRVSLLDRVLISTVCRPWRDFLADNSSLHRPRFPWLMIKYPEEPAVRIFFSPSDDGYYVLHLANTHKYTVCVAGSHGWLVFLNRRSLGGVLINPLSKASIDLPPCPLFYGRTIALSAAPTEPSCMVVGLYSITLGPCWDIYHCPIRDKTWHVRRARFVLKSNVAVKGGKFYFLCQEGLAELDFGRDRPLKWLKLKVDLLVNWDPCMRKFFMSHSDHLWLVESDGELLIVTLPKLLVDQSAPEKGGAKFMAYVYRADFANNIWAKVEDLGGRSLFLSRGACFSLSLVEVDASEYIGDRIYVLDNRVGCPWYKKGDIIWQEYTLYQGLPDQWLHGSMVEWGCWDSIWFMPVI